jgi:hypothetical protein
MEQRPSRHHRRVHGAGVVGINRAGASSSTPQDGIAQALPRRGNCPHEVRGGRPLAAAPSQTSGNTRRDALNQRGMFRLEEEPNAIRRSEGDVKLHRPGSADFVPIKAAGS